MKPVHGIVLGMLTLCLSGAAKADQLPTNDPRIQTGGGLRSAFAFALTPSAPAGIITPTFTIKSPSGSSPSTSPCILMEGGSSITSPRCFFENDITTDGTGNTITGLTFDALGISPSSVTCGFLTGSPFSSCSVVPISGGTQVDFTGGSIPFHTDFTLAFTGFPAHFSFPATATTTPEPGTLALLLTGAGALLARRRSRARS